MNIHKKFRFYAFSLVLLLTSSIRADSTLVSTYMLNYPTHVTVTKNGVVAPESTVDKIKHFFRKLKDPFIQIRPNQLVESEIQLLMVTKLDEFLQKKSTGVLPAFSCKDLNLLYNENNPVASLKKLCLNTTTLAGNFVSSFILTNPTDNLVTLCHRQNVIRFLTQDSSVSSKIISLLQTIQQNEAALAEFWKNESEQDFQTKMIGAIDDLRFIPGVNKLNNSGIYNHFSYLYDYYYFVAGALGIDPLTNFIERYYELLASPTSYDFTANYEVVSDTNFVRYTRNFPKMYANLLKGNDLHAPVLYGIKHYDQFYELVTQNKALTAIVAALQLYTTGFNLYRFNQKKLVFDFIHTKMNNVAAIVRAMHELSTIIESHSELDAHLEYASELHKYWKQNTSVSSKMKELASLLETDTFNYTTQWALRGRVKTAYKLLQEVKNELITGLVAVGEVDTMVSAAQLYSNHKNSGTPFSFVTYIEDATTPVLRIENMWNPLVVGIPVANSIVLGTDNFPRNIILTGPNAGGKTTFLKGIAISAIFAQTLGIVPADSVAITPFTKIITYMSMVDNIAAGNSLFMSEVKRANQLVNTAQENNKNHKFTLSIIDELFSGTSPEHGQAASYAIAKKLGNIPTTVTLISTHFIDTMKRLEGETELFKNYKVNGEIAANGSIYYSFTVVPGVSTINVVDAIFHKIGFDDDIIDEYNNQVNGK